MHLNPNATKIAKELLKIPDEEIQIPEAIYANAKNPLIGPNVRDRIKQNYLLRRRFFLENLAHGLLPHFITDGDGTCCFKTVHKVENTRSIGSLVDKYFLRIFLKGIVRLGGRFEINTARVGIVPGPSAVGTEGPRFRNKNAIFSNPRSPNEISSVLHEFGIHGLEDPESLELFSHLVINGLSGAVKHDPVKPLKIQEETIRYSRLVDFLNTISLDSAPDGFLARIEEIVTNKKENKPLRVLEYKSIPRVFVEHPEFSVKDYVRYIDLVGLSRQEAWTDKEFFDRLRQKAIQIPLDYYDPAKTLDMTEEELTRKLRIGTLACLTPHAFDSNNIIREDLKLEFYKTVANFTRSPQAQEWAEKNFGIPRGTELFSINGKSPSGIDFNHFATSYPGGLSEMIAELKEKGRAPEKPGHCLINIIDNHPQPYLEIAPCTSKADVLPSKAELLKQSRFVVAAGDSPGSDAVMLAQSLILGGGAYIVRGLMSGENVAEKIVELLAKKENQWHENALMEISKDSKQAPDYVSIKTGEVKSKKEWVKIFLKQYEDRIFYCNNIHENNAFNAAIMSELLHDQRGFALDFNPEHHRWAKDVIAASNMKSLETPISEANERALEGQSPALPVLKRFPFLNIPFVRNIFDPYTAGKTFDTMLSGISKTLIGLAPVEMFAEFLGFSSIATIVRRFQGYAYGFNAIASGVSRGLTQSAHKFYWQFFGEVLGFLSAFVPDGLPRGILRALNQTVLIGRANELTMRDNYNLDDFHPQAKAEAAKTYSSAEAQAYKNKREVAAKYTHEMMSQIDEWADNKFAGLIGKIPFGKVALASLIQFKQACSLAWDFVKIPALRKHTWANFFSLGQAGIPKISKNSGKTYGEVHENNTYAFAGVATLGTAMAAVLTKVLLGSKSESGFGKFIVTALTNLANSIPALGIVTAAKLVEQDQAGDPRLYTDIAKRQQKFSPETSGFVQKIAGWMIAIFGLVQHTNIGQVLYNAANGLYFQGIRGPLATSIDDAAVNSETRALQYYKDIHADSNIQGRNFAQAI